MAFDCLLIAIIVVFIALRDNVTNLHLKSSQIYLHAHSGILLYTFIIPIFSNIIDYVY